MTLVRWKRVVPSSLCTRRLSGRRNRFRIREVVSAGIRGDRNVVRDCALSSDTGFDRARHDRRPGGITGRDLARAEKAAAEIRPLQ
jgi:hypothetical protein